MRIGKEHIGQTIYGYPTGNNARMGVDRQKLQEFVVESVGHRYAALRPVCWSRSEKYDRETGEHEAAVRGGRGGNAGYVWMADPEEARELERRNARRLAVYRHGLRGLSDQQVEAIHAILFPEPTND